MKKIVAFLMFLLSVSPLFSQQQYLYVVNKDTTIYRYVLADSVNIDLSANNKDVIQDLIDFGAKSTNAREITKRIISGKEEKINVFKKYVICKNIFDEYTRTEILTFTLAKRGNKIEIINTQIQNTKEPSHKLLYILILSFIFLLIRLVFRTKNSIISTVFVFAISVMMWYSCKLLSIILIAAIIAAELLVKKLNKKK